MSLPAVANESGFALAAQPMPEMRTLGPDGWHWPVERARMWDGFAIKCRMAEDIRSLEVESTPEGLMGLGWRRQQVDPFYRAASIRAIAMAAFRHDGGSSWYDAPAHEQAGYLSAATASLLDLERQCDLRQSYPRYLDTLFGRNAGVSARLPPSPRHPSQIDAGAALMVAFCLAFGLALALLSIAANGGWLAEPSLAAIAALHGEAL